MLAGDCLIFSILLLFSSFDHWSSSEGVRMKKYCFFFLNSGSENLYIHSHNACRLILRMTMRISSYDNLPYFRRIWMFPAVTARQQRKVIQAIQSRTKLQQQWLVSCHYCWLPTHSIVPGLPLKHIPRRQLSCQPSNMMAPESSSMISVRLTTGSDKTLQRYNSFILGHFYFAVDH